LASAAGGYGIRGAPAGHRATFVPARQARVSTAAACNIYIDLHELHGAKPVRGRRQRLELTPGTRIAWPLFCFAIDA
jgi:hypothetical protein